jgi:hypothetical protein
LAELATGVETPDTMSSVSSETIGHLGANGVTASIPNGKEGKWLIKTVVDVHA